MEFNFTTLGNTVFRCSSTSILVMQFSYRYQASALTTSTLITVASVLLHTSATLIPCPYYHSSITGYCYNFSVIFLRIYFVSFSFALDMVTTFLSLRRRLAH